MKDGIVDTVGKTISGVVVKKRDQPPRYQVYFIFADNSYFELYGEDIHGISYVREGGREAVSHYMMGGEVLLERHAAT